MNLQIANHLVELRRANGYSQEDLAARLGVSRQAVSKWERAESSPDTDNLIALAQLYHVSLDALLLHTPDPEPGQEARDVFDAAKAWEAAEKAERKQRKKTWKKYKEGLLWVLTLALMVLLPLLSIAVALSPVYAVVVTLAYLITGFLLDNWHPGWLLFLSIPIYYVLLFRT